MASLLPFQVQLINITLLLFVNRLLRCSQLLLQYFDNSLLCNVSNEFLTIYVSQSDQINIRN